MESPAVLNTIKSTVHSFFPDARVLLFGSRVRGNSDRHSDFDLLIIIKNNYSAREKIGWRSKIHKALVYAVDAPFDVFLNSEKEVLSKKELPGHIVRSALLEGIEL